MASLATLATIATGAAAVVGAGASVYQGYLSNQAAQEQAHQLEITGTEELAAAQRDAAERRLAGQLVLSRQQALAAASGGGDGADAPTVVRLMSETAERTEYGVASAMYGGYSRRQTYLDSAANVRKTGSNNFIGSVLDGIGRLVSGGFETVNTADRYSLLRA